MNQESLLRKTHAKKDVISIAFFILFLIAAVSYIVWGVPTITFVEPTPPNMSYVNTSWVYINITSDEDLNQSILEWGDQSGYTNLTMSNTSLIDWYINVTSLTDYTYNYTIYAQNATGDWNQTQIRFVVVDLTKPSLIIT
jgi:hypothetical protein